MAMPLPEQDIDWGEVSEFIDDLDEYEDYPEECCDDCCPDGDEEDDDE